MSRVVWSAGRRVRDERSSGWLATEFAWPLRSTARHGRRASQARRADVRLAYSGGARLVVDGDAISVHAQTSEPITFGALASPATPLASGTVRVATTGQAAGEVQFETMLGAGESSVPSIRYFSGEDVLQHTIYPIFADPGRLSVRGTIRPADPAASTLTIGNSAPTLSSFTTTGGAPLWLVAEDGSKLVYQHDPVSDTDYLTCDGTWTLTPAPTGPVGPTATFDWMPGLSGLDVLSRPNSDARRVRSRAVRHTRPTPLDSLATLGRPRRIPTNR